jgi:hypothetical protein
LPCAGKPGHGAGLGADELHALSTLRTRAADEFGRRHILALQETFELDQRLAP